jgi:hypothetical protein
MSSLIGACLLSAAAYAPLHVLPVVIAIVINEGRASVAEAGWIGTAYMAGQLLVACALPTLGFRPSQRAYAVLFSTLLIACVLSSAPGAGAALIAAWFFIGTASGALYYFATLVVAGFRNVAVAFSTRLSVSLLVGGMALLFFRLFASSVAHVQLVASIAIALSLVLAIGLGLYHPTSAGPAVATPRRLGVSRGSAPLIMLYLLFVGQIGYWAFALRSNAHLAMSAEQSLMAIAACKIAAAFIMWPLAYRERRQSISSGFLLPGISAAAGISVAVNAELPLLFVLGLLFWEVGFNVLSARLQVKAVQIDPVQSGSWITAVIFLGAATGPAVQGHALAHGLNVAFIIVAIATALLPALAEVALRHTRSSEPSTT